MQSDAEDERPVRVADIAKELNVGRDTVYRAIRAGDLPARRIGRGRGTLRVEREDLDIYLAACRQNATAP